MSVSGNQLARLSAALLLMTVLAKPIPLQAQAENGWIGRRVVQKFNNFTLRVGDQVVDRSGKTIEFYRVERTNGDLLWLKTEGKGPSGWTPAGEVVRVDQAIDFFTQQIRAKPRDAFSYRMRATLWQDKKELDNALVDFDEAVRLEPRAAEAFANRGNAWWGKNEHDRAFADFNDAIRLDPQLAVAYYNRGVACHERKDYEKAVVDYNDAIRFDPRLVAAYYNRGNVWRAKSDEGKAIADFSMAIDLDPELALAYNNRGNAWRDKKQYDKAIADFTRAIKLAPQFVMAYNNRGNAWRDKKQYDKAIADYNNALRLHPQFALAHFNRAMAYFLSGRVEAASQAREVVDIHGWRGARSLYAVLIGHFAARRAGNADEARRFLDEAAANCDKSAWPFPVLRFLLGKIDEKALLAAAVDDEKMTDVQCYSGLDAALKNHLGIAREHFLWVIEHGNPRFGEYLIALAELERLEQENQPATKWRAELGRDAAAQ